MMNTKKRFHKVSLLISISMTAVLVFSLFLPISATDVKLDIEQYIKDLEEDFNQMASSKAVRHKSLSYVDRYFVRILKRHQPIHTLIKTNSKGKIINEVIRGEKPEKREYRDVTKERWYGFAAEGHEEYSELRKEENGRYYVFWSKPILVPSRKTGKRYIGAVAAKIDLWDCFHKIANETEEPFLVRLYKKGLYSHKWKNIKGYKEETFSVPGIKRISVRYKESEIIEEEEQLPADIAATLAEDAAEEREQVAQEDKSHLCAVIIIILIIIIAVLIAYIIKSRFILKSDGLMDSIEEKEDKENTF